MAQSEQLHETIAEEERIDGANGARLGLSRVHVLVPKT